MTAREHAGRSAPMVRPARPEDIPALAGMLGRAFADDSFFSFLAGPGPGVERRMRIGWEGLLRHGSAGLSATWTTDDLGGAAMWIPPERSASSAIENLRLIYSLGRFAGWRRLPQVSSLYTFVEKRRHHHMPGPHAYLAGIGVDPDRQGGGYGTALLRPMLERADREGFPAYLETGTSRNLPFYERAGFRVVEELTIPDTGVSGWLMVRDPA